MMWWECWLTWWICAYWCCCHAVALLTCTYCAITRFTRLSSRCCGRRDIKVREVQPRKVDLKLGQSCIWFLCFWRIHLQKSEFKLLLSQKEISKETLIFSINILLKHFLLTLNNITYKSFYIFICKLKIECYVLLFIITKLYKVQLGEYHKEMSRSDFTPK